MNRYIVGQLTLLLGASAVMLMAFAPSAIGQFVGSHIGLSWAGEMPEHAAALLRTCRTLSIVMALAGMVLSPIAYLRERPPLLPVVGGVLCVLALGWHSVVWTFYLLTLAVVVWLLIDPLGGLVHLFISSVISAIFGIRKSVGMAEKDHMTATETQPASPKPKRHWFRYPLWILLVLIVVGILFVSSPRYDSASIDSVTGSIKFQTRWFGFSTSTVIQQSAIEKWIIHHEGHYTNNWRFLSGSPKNVFGLPAWRECGRLPEIWGLEAGWANDRFVRNASDQEIGTLVQVMRTGTTLEKKNAVEAASEKALK
jgi:hypothetical protein